MCSPTLTKLPPPPPGRTGWPWTEESQPLSNLEPDERSWPRISVVTPSYNQGQFIEETIRSVLLQGYPDLEYIVIDGGSTDESVDIIRKYADWLAYWVSEPDRGQVDAINKGFARATGDILVWLNSDDIYVYPKTLGRVVSLFQQYPQVDVVTGAGVILSEDGHWVRQTEALQSRAYYEQLRYRDCILQPATFFKREVLDSVQLDESLHYAFDWEFFIRLTKHYNLLVVNEVWAGARAWGQSKTVAGGATRAREQAEVIKRYVGSRSWQYWTLEFFHLLYRVAERMPVGLQTPLKSAIRATSRIASTLSYRRIPVV